MKLREKIILKCTPFESMEEYNEARKIYSPQVRIYSKQLQFKVGMFFFILSIAAISSILINISLWFGFLFIPLLFGFICILDSISEHYCLKIYRFNKGKKIDLQIPIGSPPEQIKKQKSFLSYMLIYLIIGFILFLSCLSIPLVMHYTGQLVIELSRAMLMFLAIATGVMALILILGIFSWNARKYAAKKNIYLP